MKIQKILFLSAISFLLMGCNFSHISISNNSISNSSDAPISNNLTDEISLISNEDSTAIESSIDDTNYFPTEEIKSFFLEKDIVGITIPEIKVSSSSLLGVEKKSINSNDFFEVTIKGNRTSEYLKAATSVDYSIYSETYNTFYKDKENKTIFECKTKSGNTIIDYYSYDEFALANGGIIDDEGIRYTSEHYVFDVKTSLKNYNNLNNISVFLDQINYEFKRGSGSNDPIVSNDNGYHVRFYTNNTLTIASSLITFKAITFNVFDNRAGVPTASNGKISQEESVIKWVGESKNVTFTGTNQLRFSSIELDVIREEKVIPTTDGVLSIKEIKESFKDYSYTPNNVGWYLTDYSVKVQVAVLDVIDSASEGGEYDALARGKVLACDASDTIIISSGTTSNNPISFYSAAKKYMNSRSCYEVEGYVAFFNGVMEIKVSSYKYNSNLHVTYNVEDFVTKEISSQEELLNDLLPLKTNNAGYNVNKIVRMNDLSFLSFYNSAGSYLFIDKNGKIIPVYTFNNKDSFDISSTNLMNVIAVETMYKNRPSLRLLSVDYDDEKEKNNFDFVNDVIEVSDFSSFANVGFSSDDNYRKSELSIYKADVYVSSYAYDKYTINTSYYSYKESGHTYYTTGNSQVNASKHDSLGVFNENCTYNGYFDDYLIDYCSSEEEVKDCQFTIYFTLAYLDRVDGKNMWRVNVFTDMINKI